LYEIHVGCPNSIAEHPSDFAEHCRPCRRLSFDPLNHDPCFGYWNPTVDISFTAPPSPSIILAVSIRGDDFRATPCHLPPTGTEPLALPSATTGCVVDLDSEQARPPPSYAPRPASLLNRLHPSLFSTQQTPMPPISSPSTPSSFELSLVPLALFGLRGQHHHGAGGAGGVLQKVAAGWGGWCQSAGGCGRPSRSASGGGGGCEATCPHSAVSSQGGGGEGGTRRQTTRRVDGGRDPCCRTASTRRARQWRSSRHAVFEVDANALA